MHKSSRERAIEAFNNFPKIDLSANFIDLFKKYTLNTPEQTNYHVTTTKLTKVPIIIKLAQVTVNSDWGTGCREFKHVTRIIVKPKTWYNFVFISINFIKSQYKQLVKRHKAIKKFLNKGIK